MKEIFTSKNIYYSVIVPAYNEEEYIEDTLDSIFQAMEEITGQKGEVIVVDNNSTDKTAELALSKGARLIFEKENQISRARNKGVEIANGEVLFFVDADTKVHKRLLNFALERIKFENVGGGGSVLIFDSDQNNYFFGKLVPNFWVWISKKFKLAAGSFIFCKSELFKLAGSFPENLFAGEEILFSLNYKKICKNYGQEFVILDKYPVVTSSRKLVWFNSIQILVFMIVPIIFPFVLRWKSFCSFWYKRPSTRK